MSACQEDILDSEEELNSEDNGGESDATTRVLGDWDDETAECAKKGKGKRQADQKPSQGTQEASETMRGTYWQVVHEAQKRIKKDNPKMSAKEVLKLARES